MFDNAAIDGGEVTLRSGTTDWQCPRHVRFAPVSDQIAALRQWPVSELVNSARAPDEDPTLIDRVSL